MRLPIMEELRVSRRLFGAGWLYHQAVPTAEGIAVTLRDVSSRKREERSLRRASLTDDLTSLYNRRGFLMLSEQQLRVARRQEKDAVLLYVDMDDFKALNDKFGHAEGDRALTAVGRLLRRAVRDSDVVARMGGDEFTIMALDADRAAARLIQRRIEERIMLLNATGELAAPLSLTIGHTRVRPTDPASLTELLARADALLYARKKRRKVQVGIAIEFSSGLDCFTDASGQFLQMRRVFFDHGEAGPAYAVAAGLLRHRLDNTDLELVDGDFQPSLAHLGASVRNAVHGMWNWLRENF